MEPEPGRPGLVAALHVAEPSKSLQQRRNVVCDRRQRRRLSPPGLGNCDRDRVCVDIETDESYVFHGWTRLPLWLCAVEFHRFAE